MSDKLAQVTNSWAESQSNEKYKLVTTGLVLKNKRSRANIVKGNPVILDFHLVVNASKC